MTARHTQAMLEDRARLAVNGTWRRFILCDDKPIAIAQGETAHETESNAARLALCWNMHDRLVGALKSLANETHGSVLAMNEAAREVISNTNYNILEAKYDKAIALLAEIDGAT